MTARSAGHPYPDAIPSRDAASDLNDRAGVEIEIPRSACVVRAAIWASKNRARSRESSAEAEARQLPVNRLGSSSLLARHCQPQLVGIQDRLSGPAAEPRL
jgi:hypothetical protein